MAVYSPARRAVPAVGFFDVRDDFFPAPFAQLPVQFDADVPDRSRVLADQDFMFRTLTVDLQVIDFRFSGAGDRLRQCDGARK